MSKHVIVCLVGAVALSLMQLQYEGYGMVNWDKRKLETSLSSSVTSSHLVLSPQDSNTPNSNSTTHVSTALCHKTLYGTPDLKSIGIWAKYHHLLGFDHIFVGYVADISRLPDFETLQQTPYITLYENKLGRVKSKSNGNLVMAKGKGDQIWDQDMCLQVLAKDYDWAMMQDSDEFLWFNRQVGVKEFLSDYRAFNYISFGKHIYSASQYVELERREPFGLAQFPFTLGSFCHAANRPGKDYCPDWRGRSKLMVRPQLFAHVFSAHTGIRGRLNKTEGQIHLTTDRAHLKEWPAIFKTNRNITVRPAETYFVADGTVEAIALKVHNKLSRAYKRYRGMEFKVMYDSELQEWLYFVASRGNVGTSHQ